jgi:hypothetical protein
MLKKITASLMIFPLIIAAAVSCAAPGASEASLIPASANVVVQMQVGKILSNPALQLAYGELAKGHTEWPQTTTDALSQFLQKTGFDLSSISTVDFFADVVSANETQNAYAGAIASGTFNEPALVAKAQQQTKQALTTSDYKGMTVYSGGQDKFEIVFLSPSKMALGTPKAVKDVIDLSKGNGQPLTGSTIDTLKRVGPGLVVGAFAPPQSLRDQIGKNIPQKGTISPQFFQDADALGFAIDQAALNVSVRIDVHFSNAASVQSAKDTITGLISVARGSTQDQNVKTALGNIQVSTGDSWLSVRDVANPADIATLINGLQAQK